MNTENDAPQTLLEAVTYFADPEVAFQFVVTLRWPNGPECIECGSANVGLLKTRKVFKCRECKRQFSVKVGTVFEDSPISLSKWLPAMWLIVNCKNGISSYELARALKVTQKTAWFMLHRIRLAMQSDSFGLMEGDVEADETFVGGKAINMHEHRRQRMQKEGAHVGKVAVFGLLERSRGDKASRVRAEVVPNTRKKTLMPRIYEAVRPGSNLHTDALLSYRHLGTDYRHAFVDHATKYVAGNVHTNGMENFWSLLKRAVRGTYVSVDPFHLFRYLDEQVYRFNHRKETDAGRFLRAAANIIGKRLTYDELTGRGLATT